MATRQDISLPNSTAVFTTSSTVSVGLTITGETGNSIYLTRLTTSYTGAAQTVNQATKIFDGSTEVYRFAGLTGVDLVFYSPLKVKDGNNLVATLSVSVNTIAGNVALTYYRE